LTLQRLQKAFLQSLRAANKMVSIEIFGRKDKSSQTLKTLCVPKTYWYVFYFQLLACQRRTGTFLLSSFTSHQMSWRFVVIS
jgi:hypothetical protein